MQVELSQEEIKLLLNLLDQVSVKLSGLAEIQPLAETYKKLKDLQAAGKVAKEEPANGV